jgi:hypothetical protein
LTDESRGEHDEMTTTTLRTRLRSKYQLFGEFTTVESDKHNPAGKGFDRADIHKLKLDGSGAMERLTYFADVPTYRSFNIRDGPIGSSRRYRVRTVPWTTWRKPAASLR